MQILPKEFHLYSVSCFVKDPDDCWKPVRFNVQDFCRSPSELFKRYSFDRLCVTFQNALGKAKTLLETNALGWEVWWKVESAKPRRKANRAVSNG